ncbi:MAG: aminotransferase class III-fold pyridoxal phosphate-dependent enzyme [Bryobacteraceae bacterium]
MSPFESRTPGSRTLFERAARLLPNGVTHVARHLEPYPIYVERAAGSRKWDVDGNEYIDYFGGHGALILGHCHPEVTEAVREQASRGAHYGASHRLEVEWAELIASMIPSAQRVRFTVTGTEATHLALRLARAYTGKPKVMRFAGHFHGWHDHVAFQSGGAAGVVQGIVDDGLLCASLDPDRVRETIEGRDDIAAVIVEPTGATFGHVPLPMELLRTLRDVTARRGVVLIFDEVISGFRCSPGGAQALYAITPDLTTLAKIIAGGYPGAAVVGRPDLFDALEFRSPDGRMQSPAVAHQGTYNAGPVSAAAGIATLRIVRDTDALAQANRVAAAIRDGINRAIDEKGLNWCAYGRFSDFHIYAAGGEDRVTPEAVEAGRVPAAKLKGGTPMELIHRLRIALLCEGVDIAGWPGGLTSAAHGDEDVERTVAAFRRVLGAVNP